MSRPSAPRPAFLLALAGALALLLCSLAGCAAPASAWIGGGTPSALEVGVVSGRQALVPGGASWEASLSARRPDGRDAVPGLLRPAAASGGCATTPRATRPGEHAKEEYLGRLGLRWALLPVLHVGGGLDTDLRPYARLGLERALTPQVSLGLDLVEDSGGMEGLVTLRWSR